MESDLTLWSCTVLPSKQIVFIHGMYMTGDSWQPWLDRLRPDGFTCHAPSWPYHQDTPTALRADVDPALGSLTFGAVIGYLKQFIDTLPERPILIGHSIGGLAVQKLVNDGYAAAGVSISPAPPRGIVTASPHFLRANFPHANPLAGNRPIRMTPKRFQYTFCNTMSRQASDEAFERYAVPESRNVPRSTLTRQGAVDFAKPHVPLLLIAADRDHLTPLGLVKRNAKAYKTSAGVADFKAFQNRSHFICNQDGWEEVADYALNWLAER
jgi:pimeloyl-ACP methyl ester carboxylesterase